MPAAHNQGFCDRLKRLNSVHTLTVAAELMGISVQSASRIRTRGFKANTGKARRPMPGDFPIQAHHMKISELAAHYQAGWTTVRRWAREVARQSQRRSPVVYSVPSREDLESVLEGQTMRAAAADLGVNVGTLRKWRRLREMKIVGEASPTKIGWAEARFSAAQSQPHTRRSPQTIATNHGANS